MRCDCRCHDHGKRGALSLECCDCFDMDSKQVDALAAYLLSHREDIELRINDFETLAPLLAWLDRR